MMSGYYSPHRRSGWGWLVGFAIAAAIIVTFAVYRGSAEQTTIAVERCERHEDSGYLAWTDQGVVSIQDSWAFTTWNASDRYGQICSDLPAEYDVTLAGWRIPFLSTYKNVVEVHDEIS